AVPGTVTVRPPAGEAPPGTRGTLETVGAVLVTVQASVELLRVIHAGVREWLSRTPAAEASSSLRVQVGDAKVDIAEVTPEQQERLITEILRILAEDDDRD
ncbi:MAG TPA: hypothetical protein VFR35_11195, partial [Actinoplanes sp.]|nr:hypothetical protein [Actinoplanes sp.]